MRLVLMLLCVLIMAPSVASAQSTVEVAPIAPYTEVDEEGRWSGPAIDLMRAAADRAGTGITFERAEPDALERGPSGGALAALPVFAGPDTPAGTLRSLPLASDSVGLLGAGGGGTGFVSKLAGLFNWGFFRIALALAVLLLVVGTIFWLVERGNNEGIANDEGESPPLSGIGHGFWWAGVTATTIGYGDTVPKTLPGRTVAMIWMLFSMALTAVLTAYLVSLTGGGGSSVALAEEIENERVGVVAAGAVPEMLLAPAGSITSYPTLAAARDALERGEVDKVAHPYRALKAEASGESPTRSDGDTLIPVVLLGEGNEALRSEIDRIVLTRGWQQRMAEDQGA